jgi:hypothetical protein
MLKKVCEMALEGANPFGNVMFFENFSEIQGANTNFK